MNASEFSYPACPICISWVLVVELGFNNKQFKPHMMSFSTVEESFGIMLIATYSHDSPILQCNPHLLSDNHNKGYKNSFSFKSASLAANTSESSTSGPLGSKDGKVLGLVDSLG